MDDERTSITHKVAVKLGKPGPEAWKDASGNPAPPNVRRAADNLWDAVEREGTAAANVGWGKKEVGPFCGVRACLCCMTCGFTECMHCLGGTFKDDGNFCIDGTRSYYSTAESSIVKTQRVDEREEAFSSFKNIVNSSVLNPEQYSGDANICELGPWVVDNVSSWDGDPLTNVKFHSGRRDLSHVSQSTMEFVNKHGGWNTKADKPLILKTEMRGNTLHIDF